MTKNDIANFRAGYDECRQIIQYDLRKALNADDLRVAITEILHTLDADAEADHWRNIHEEFAGITKEDYQAELLESFNHIREKFYSKAGYIKPRLIKKNDNT